MTSIFIQIGLLCVALIMAIYFQIYTERKKSLDCRLFGWVLLATAAILTVDTIGWIIDGKPILGQVWFTTIIDGLDLIITSTVCWCWVQYALHIAGKNRATKDEWYKDLSTWLLLLQIILVSCSQIFNFYYSVDATGVYHRERGYFIHTTISLTMLIYSSVNCLWAYYEEKKKDNDEEKKREMLFVAFIIVIPILGNVFQYYIYGYPTVWLCMVFMVFTVYIHIQNKRMNHEREKQNQKLEEALKQAQIANHAKTDFLSQMSHDMRTPMNGILGITSLLRDRTNPEEIRSDVDQIEKSGKYLLSLINDTLDMNKIESGKMELHPKPINSEDLFGNVIVTAQVLAAQKGVHLIMELPPIAHGEWIPVIADASRVEQVFMNIITNAVKFTPPGGDVAIHMDTYDVTEDAVTDLYIISDTGIGMSEEFQKHLFEPFAQEGRTNTEHENGTGLGLSIVKQIVNLMGGTIEIESEIDKGTKVKLLLTYPRYHGTLCNKAEIKTDLSILKGKRILLCEDHPINAQIAIRLLEKKGMLVEHAENGQIGLEKFKASQEGYYAAILMDIRMPVMNGLEAAKAIRNLKEREDGRTIPIIAMTANAFDEDIRQCEEAGMNEHLSKPVDLDNLYQVIAQHVTDREDSKNFS